MFSTGKTERDEKEWDLLFGQCPRNGIYSSFRLRWRFVFCQTEFSRVVKKQILGDLAILFRLRSSDLGNEQFMGRRKTSKLTLVDLESLRVPSGLKRREVIS